MILTGENDVLHVTLLAFRSKVIRNRMCLAPSRRGRGGVLAVKPLDIQIVGFV